MTAVAKPLGPEDRIRASNRLHAAMSHGRETAIKGTALGLAVLLHLGAMLIHFPDMRGPEPDEPQRNVIVVKRYIPPPPEVVRREPATREKVTRKVPIPDPTPDAPEPIREPEPEELPEPLPDNVEILLGVPTPPPPVAPLIAGTGGVTNPRLIQESKIPPEYPELARLARLEGKVILQAVIDREGHVCDLRVLRCNRPHLGFEEAAVAAVEQWRYEPATQNGRPVEVYFTVFVDFSLL